MTIAFLINALWWLGMTLPLLKNYKQVNFVEKQEHPIRDSFKRLGHTLSTLNEDKKVFFYLISFFFYIMVFIQSLKWPLPMAVPLDLIQMDY